MPPIYVASYAEASADQHYDEPESYADDRHGVWDGDYTEVTDYVVHQPMQSPTAAMFPKKMSIVEPAPLAPVDEPIIYDKDYAQLERTGIVSPDTPIDSSAPPIPSAPTGASAPPAPTAAAPLRLPVMPRTTPSAPPASTRTPMSGPPKPLRLQKSQAPAKPRGMAGAPTEASLAHLAAQEKARIAVKLAQQQAAHAKMVSFSDTTPFSKQRSQKKSDREAFQAAMRREGSRSARRAWERLN